MRRKTVSESEIRIAGFSGEPGAPRNVITASHGAQRSGKTWFGLTMPKPVGVIPLDRNTRRTVERYLDDYPEHRGKILLPDEDLIRSNELRTNAKMSDKQALDHYLKHRKRVEDLYFRLLDNTAVKSILIDKGTNLWEDVLFSLFGRDQKIWPLERAAPNRYMRNLITACGEKHLIVTHDSKEIWRNNEPTGKMAPEGWKHIAAAVNVIIEHEKVTRKGETTFVAKPTDCQERPDLVGDRESELSGDECAFPYLAVKLYPDSEIGDWE